MAGLHGRGRESGRGRRMDKGKRKINTGGKVSKPSVLLFHFEGQEKI